MSMAVATKKKKSKTKPNVRKVTVLLPADLVNDAMDASGENLTTTIEEGLRKVAAHKAYQYFLTRKGAYKFSVDVQALRD